MGCEVDLSHLVGQAVFRAWESIAELFHGKNLKTWID